jgi:hypothetical protein
MWNQLLKHVNLELNAKKNYFIVQTQLLNKVEKNNYYNILNFAGFFVPSSIVLFHSFFPVALMSLYLVYKCCLMLAAFVKYNILPSSVITENLISIA